MSNVVELKIENQIVGVKPSKTKRVRRVVVSKAWLKRELAEARADLSHAERRISDLNIVLEKKNDELTQALNDRDLARDERDDMREKNKDAISFLSGLVVGAGRDIKRLLDEKGEIIRLNQANFDKACRNMDMASVLALILVNSGYTPDKLLADFTNLAPELGVSPEVLEDLGNALKRAFVRKIEMSVAQPSALDMYKVFVAD